MPDSPLPAHRPPPWMGLLHRIAPWVDRIRLARLQMCGVHTRVLCTAQGEIHALEVAGRGTAPPILLIHGLGSCALDFDALILRLRRHCRKVVAIDLPGHGFSPPPALGMELGPMRALVVEAFDQLIDEPHVIFGNSLGGFVTVRLAAARPAQCLGLVLVSPAGTPVSSEKLAETVQRFHLRDRAAARAFVDACMSGPSRYRPLISVGVRERMARETTRALINQINDRDMLKPEELQGLAMPVLLFWGADDSILDEQHFEFYRSNLPNQQGAHRRPGFGHAPHVDRLSGFVAALLPFLRGLAADPQSEV